MAIKTYNCTALTGGAVRSLDAISQAVLTNGDRAMTVVGGKLYVHVFNSASTAAESSPVTIRPDDYSGPGVWENQSSPFGDVGPTITSTVPMQGDIRGGDITVSGSTLTITPCSCKDSTGLIALYTGVNKTLVLPSGAGTENDLWLIAMVRLVADGSIAFQYYADQAAIDADATIDAHRIIDFAQNDSAGTAAKAFYTKNGIHWMLKVSENSLNSPTAIPADCNTAINLAAFLPPASMVDEVLFGGQSATAQAYVALGIDGANVHHSFSVYHSTNGDTDLMAWSYSGAGSPAFVPIVNNTIYWGDGTYANTSTAKLLLHSVKLRR